MSLSHRGAYPTDWHMLAKRVKEDAGERCIRCFHPNDGQRVRTGMSHCDAKCTHPKNGKLRVLTVHHLDGDKSNSRWWNLLALCQVCHLQVQAKVDPDQMYLWEHSEWFKAYVAGYYAFTYAGLELTREEVDRALEHWIFLGQPHRMEMGVTA